MPEAPPHPGARRVAFAPWKPGHLYIDDSGQVLCGRCMGVESTYHPWAWSDLGAMDADGRVTFRRTELGRLFEGLSGPETVEFRCELDPKNSFTH